ncbi:hypothetical protein RQP46_010220 [Phenoliferia psychrophenolica]
MLASTFWLATTFALGASAVASPVTQITKRSGSQTVTVRNSETLRFDVDGNGPLDVGSHKLAFLDNQYIIYGNQYGCGFEWYNFAAPNCTIGSFFSTAIYNSLCAPTAASGGCGRPHVIHHAASNKYILYINGGTNGYTAFKSDSPIGGFEIASTPSVGVAALAHGDFTVEVINGRGVMIYSAFDFSAGGSIWPPFHQRTYIQYLTSDYLNTTGEAWRVASPADDEVDLSTESPDIFTRNGMYYVTATNTCGFCNGTLSIVFRSSSIKGPWTRQIISADGCGGQMGSLLPIKAPSGGTTYLASMDRWVGGNNEAQHGIGMQPLYFNRDGSVKDLDCSSEAEFSFQIPSDSTGTRVAKAVTDSSALISDYSVVCDIGKNQVTQTWLNTKTGTLKEVGVNMAITLQDVPMTATIFKYENNTNFFTPSYKWTELYTETLQPANFSRSLDVVSFRPVNVTVKAGERLGISFLAYASVNAPYCRLEHTVPAFNEKKTTNGLFLNGVGQVSIRGKDGNASPVFASSGKELKWFSVVH